MKIVPIGSQPSFHKLLIYGPPGVGKTALSASLQGTEYGDVLFIPLEEGLRSVPPGGALTLESPPRTILELQKVLNELRKLLSDPENTVKTVVLDSASEMLVQAVKFLTKAPDTLTGFAAMQIQHWGNVKSMFSQLAQELRKLPSNVIIIAHENTVRSESTGGVEAIDVGLNKKSADELKRIFDHVWYMTASIKGDRHLTTGPLGPIFAKSRVPDPAKFYAEVGGVQVKNPDLGKLFRALDRK